MANRRTAKQSTKGAAPTASATAETIPVPETPSSESKSEAYRKMYKVHHLGVGSPSSAKMEKYRELEKLAKHLSCQTSQLIWHAIYEILDSPPETLRDDVERAQTGTAAGFWLDVKSDEETGLAVSTRVVEVQARGDVAGHTFFRYEAGDEKARARAARQAVKAEVTMRKLLGLPELEAGDTSSSLL